MAGISFMDLLFAEALASGLAREAQARRTERPPPDNFFVLPRDPQGWRQIQVACKKENMVIAIEITDNRNENCRRIHPHFVDMAREFDSVPFLRVVIGPGATYDELRKDVGGVQFTPTIVLVWFGEGSTYRAKFEGEGEIRQALGTGRLNGVMKEFLERRVKLKLAEHMAEELATHVRDEMSEREKRIRRDYEEKLRREMVEKEELQQKEEEEKKRKEEEEEKKMDEKRRRAAEIRRDSRPQNLEELMKMDLDTAPTRDIKAIMVKMGISPHDCFEKSDLKKKLIANVPELRIATERKASQSSISSVSSTSSFSSGINNLSDPLGASGYQNDSLRKLEDEVADLKQKLSQKDVDIRCLTTDLHRMTTRANSAEDQVLALKRDASAVKTPPVPKPRGYFTRSASSTNDLQQVEELKKQLYEMRMLYTTTIDDYDILSLVHVGDGEGIVFRAKCTRKGMPNPDRIYAMKVLTNYFQTQTATQTRVQFQNEYQVLCQIPRHENIIHLFAFFFDRANPDISPHFRRCGANARTMSLFLLMDEHLMNMKQQLDTLVENQGPKAEKVVKWFIDLLKGLTFLDSHHVVHRDLKLENLLLDEMGRVIVSDFGTAVMLDDTMAIPFSHGFNVGGNQAHLSPEILNARPGPRRNISYKKQAVWAAGVLAYEFAGHSNPFSSGTIDQRGYSVDALQPLRYTYCKNSKFVQPLPRDFIQLVRSMLQPEAYDRPTLQECLKRLTPLCN